LRDLRVGMRFVHLAPDRVTPAVDDSFVFAYRVVEDFRAAAAGALGEKPDKWPPLNVLLGTDEDEMKERTKRLREARNACAHADPDHEDLVAARADFANVICIARDLLADALGARFVVERRYVREL